MDASKNVDTACMGLVLKDDGDVLEILDRSRVR